MPDLGAMMGGGGGLGGMLGGGGFAQAAPAPVAAPEPAALPQENILSTATGAAVITSGGIGSSDPSVGAARD